MYVCMYVCMYVGLIKGNGVAPSSRVCVSVSLSVAGHVGECLLEVATSDATRARDGRSRAGSVIQVVTSKTLFDFQLC
jgi:hypothetical protein